MKPTTLHFSMALAASLVAGAAVGHDDKSKHQGRAAASEAPYGHAADPARATRTIAIDMSDQLRFSPAQVSVQKGEVVRFLVKNSGKLEHEFVLGTLPELKEHAQMMQKQPGMEHDAPQMAHVAPGKAVPLHPEAVAFAGHYGFGIDVLAAYRPTGKPQVAYCTPSG